MLDGTYKSQQLQAISLESEDLKCSSLANFNPSQSALPFDLKNKELETLSGSDTSPLEGVRRMFKMQKETPLQGGCKMSVFGTASILSMPSMLSLYSQVEDEPCTLEDLDAAAVFPMPR